MSQNVDSSSSSEDETSIEAFKEACDETFLPQSLFDTKQSAISGAESNVGERIKPSLRARERTDNFEPFGVSQSFKDHVAKKLDALLDRSIIDQIVDNRADDIPKKRKKKRATNNAGIKLLSSSDKVIAEVEDSINGAQKRVAKSCAWTREVERSNKIKCREVAVDPDWILSKSETEAWSERCRGAVFEYKRSCDGALVERL